MDFYVRERAPARIKMKLEMHAELLSCCVTD